jgi:hypothetical protein
MDLDGIDKLFDTLHKANLANQGIRSYPRIPIPWRVVYAIHQRAGNCCEECGGNGGKLHLHHLTYRPDPELNSNSKL